MTAQSGGSIARTEIQGQGQEIAVVGAGIIGVTTAYHLARAGHRVTVIDRAAGPAETCSFANAGIIAVGHAESWAGPAAPRQMLRALSGRDPSVKVSRLMDPALWRWGLGFLRNCSATAHQRNSDAMLRLARLGRNTLQQMEAELGFAFAQGHDGAVYLYTSAQQYAARLQGPVDGETGFAACSAEQLIEMDPALRAFAGTLQGGLVSGVDSKGDCRAFTLQLADWLGREKGVRFRFGCTVTGIERDAHRATALLTDHGRIDCAQIVLAAGVATPELLRPLGLRASIYPVKGYSATYPILDPSRIPARPFVDETSLLAVTRLDDRLRVTAIAEFAGHDNRVRPDRLAYLDDYVRRHFKGAVDLDGASHWAGLRPTTPSGRPYLGQLKPVPNIWINAGHGQLGWTMSAGAGLVLANQIAGQASGLGAISEQAGWLNAPQ